MDISSHNADEAVGDVSADTRQSPSAISTVAPGAAIPNAAQRWGDLCCSHTAAQARNRLFALALLLAAMACVIPFLRSFAYRGTQEFHAAIELTGGLVAVLAGIGFVARFYNLGERFLLLVGLAFFVNGAKDLVHGFLALANSRQWIDFAEAHFQQSVPATGVSGRILMATLLILAVVLPLRRGKPRNPKRETIWVSLLVLAATGAATALLFALPLPRFRIPEYAISRPVDFASAGLFAVAFALFLARYRRTRDPLVWWLALSIGVSVIGQGIMGFSKQLGDLCYDMGHVYKVIGYSVPILGFALFQIATLVDTQRIGAMLAREKDSLRLNEARLQALLELNQMTSASMQQITDFALEAAVSLTGSKIGYLAFLNDDESVLTMHSWSKAAMAECAIIDKPIVYPVVATGLWGEAVRQRKPVLTNDYPAVNPLKKGYPQGHVHVLRHMNAPVFDGERIVIVAGVGNKDAPYDEADVRQLTLLMQGMWQLIQRRRSQERLAHLNAVLRAVRNVNQLITREKQRDRLMAGVCECLTEARGYQQAWAMIDDGPESPTIWAEAGVGEAWSPMAARLRRGEAPPCVERCLAGGDVSIAAEDQCVAAGCPLLERCKEHDAAAVCVRHAETTYGVLSVTLPRGMADDPEERALLHEVAGDVGFALHGVALEQRRAQAEEQLRRAHDELEARVQERTGQLLRANVEMEQARRAAEAASRAKSTFLANMSHEIRTPLNAVIGMTELLLRGALSAQQREYLVTVKDSGEALLSVINDILDFSKIEAGKLVLDHTTFDLRESLGDTMKSFALRAHQRGLELACFIHPEVPHMVEGDYGRLRQVVVNLVGNAIKFTERGEVSLEVTQLSRSEKDVVLHFLVSDTGTGIPEEKRATIFGMFEQADSSTTRRHGGTGLGLAIASKLVALMDGRLWLESEVGRGSRFHFNVRLALGEKEPPETTPPEPACLHEMRVLVVDDNATNRHILEETLRSWRMAPTMAAGAEEALDLLRRATAAGQPFHFILSDAHMPHTDGFTLAEQIKQDPAVGSTIIMMLTSGDRPEDTARCEQLGIAAYLLKPVKQSELLEAIEAALGLSMPSEELLEAASQPRHVSSLHVLLAEDSLVNQKLATALLESQGHTVAVVGSGKQAVAATETQAFDLVLMDVQMPEMDGLEATAQIRSRERRTGAHVPIIAMTAHALKGDRERCLEAGMDDYISKPIRAEELFNLIDGLFVGHAGKPPAASDVPLDVVDWTKALKSAQGNRKVLKAMAEAALEEIPALLAAIRQSLADDDGAKLKFAAHTLKGAVRYFGANQVCGHAAQLEEIGQKGRPAEAKSIVAALEIEAARLTVALAEYLRTG